MTRSIVRTLSLLIALATFASLPLAAQVIPKGVDYWVTPPQDPQGESKVTLQDGDVESLCHAKGYGTWDHTVVLKGIPNKPGGWDSAVARLDTIRFNKAGEGFTRVQFKSLAMASTNVTDTPCGKLKWEARLAKNGKQPITRMKVTKTSPKGGLFFADLALRVEMRATKADGGARVGTLFYDVKLPDPKGGTVWSLGKGDAFRPGVSERGAGTVIERISPVGRERVTHRYTPWGIEVVSNN